MKVIVLLPTFKNLKQTQKFIDSLSDNAELLSVMVLILDADPDLEIVTSLEHPKNINIKIIAKENLWWGEAINFLKCYCLEMGFDSDLVICANSDVSVTKGLESFLNYVITINSVVHSLTVDQDGNNVTSGQRLISWFPYITHNIQSIKKDEDGTADFLNARFCVWPSSIFFLMPAIPKAMPQYCGDYFLTHRCKLSGVNLLVSAKYTVLLDDRVTGVKTDRLRGFHELINSFSSTRSSNNLQARFSLTSSFNGRVKSRLILVNMIVNVFLKYFIGVLRDKSSSCFISKKW